MRFQATENTVWLRFPVKLTHIPHGLMTGDMYTDTLQKAQQSRQCALPGAQSLLSCGLLPVHSAVHPEWLRQVAHHLVTDAGGASVVVA